MVFTLLLILLTSNPEPLWVLKDHGIYERISSQSAALDEAGNLYLVNSEEALVLKISPSGEIERRFGGKGKGPGEMTRPKIIQVEGDKVYVSDYFSRKILQFTQDGVYQTSLDHGAFVPILAKTRNHWLYFSPIIDAQKPHSFELVIADKHFKERRQLIYLERGKGPYKDEPIFDLKFDPATQRSVVGFNPAISLLFITPCCQGTRAVVALPGIELKLIIYDGLTGEVLREVNHARAPIPFNKEWGQAKFKETVEKVSSSNIEYRENFPQFFPAVRSMRVFEDGTIYITTWGAHPEIENQLMAFNEKGQLLETNLSSKALDAVLGDRGERVWIQFETEEEEPIFACIKKEDLASFVIDLP